MFGADKSCSPAVLLAGLLVFDPSFKLMVVKNVAAHAIAEHLVALQLLQDVQLIERLVGYYEQPLDLPVENCKNDRSSCLWASATIV